GAPVSPAHGRLGAVPRFRRSAGVSRGEDVRQRPERAAVLLVGVELPICRLAAEGEVVDGDALGRIVTGLLDAVLGDDRVRVHPDDLLESRPLAAGEYGLAVRILDVARRPELIRVGGIGLLPGSVTVGRAPDDRGEPGPVLGLGHARGVESALQGGSLAVRGVLVAPRDGGAVLEELVAWRARGTLVQRVAVLGSLPDSQRRGPHLLRAALDGGDLSGGLVLGRAPPGVRQGLRREDLLAAGVASQRVSGASGRERLGPGGGSGA